MARICLRAILVVSIILSIVGIATQNVLFAATPLVLLYIVDHDVLPLIVFIPLVVVLLFVCPVELKVAIGVRECITIYKTIIHLLPKGAKTLGR